jgi:hypothetical protein
MARTPTWEISREGDITRIDFNQSPSREEMLDLMDELDRMDGSDRRLYVMVKAELLLSTAEVREGAQVARSSNNQPSRIAMVAPGNITYGISRIFKVFRESEDTAFAVFRDIDEARDWLNSDRPAPES